MYKLSKYLFSVEKSGKSVKDKEHFLRKKEIIFITIILLLSTGWLFLQQRQKVAAGQVIVQLEGEIFGTYTLEEQQWITIKDHNLLEINEGKIRMKEAQCPDQICVKQGWINKEGDSIVCLPNKVIITLKKKEDKLDGVVR